MDVTTKSRLAFWAMILAVLLFSAVPSLVMVDKAREYWRFLSGWSPGTLRQLTVRRVPSTVERSTDLDLSFVEFKLVSPEAKKVRLAGSFNRWDPASMPLRRGKDGAWETAVALPAGTYAYEFEVDGAWTPDPAAKEKSSRDGREVSVRVVR